LNNLYEVGLQAVLRPVDVVPQHIKHRPLILWPILQRRGLFMYQHQEILREESADLKQCLGSSEL